MRRYQLVAILSLVIFAAGCSKTELPAASNLTPKQVVDYYLDAAIHSDFTNAYKYISDKDKLKVTREMFVTHNKQYKDYYPIKDIMRGIVYEIDEPNLDGDTATVRVKMRVPLLACIAGDMFVTPETVADTADQETYKRSLALAQRFTKESYMECRSDSDFLILNDMSINLTKDPGGWKVYLNIEGQNLTERNADETIKQLVTTASERKQTEKESKAQERLNEIKRIEADAVKEGKTAYKSRLQEMERYYISKVELQDTGVSFTPEGTGVFYGELINHGDSVLKDVEITIRGLDKASNELFTLKYHPLLIETDTIRKYILPGQSKQLSYNLLSTPRNWGGAIETKITQIKLVED